MKWTGEQERDAAARKIQAFARRLRGRESFLLRATRDNPFLNPPDPTRLHRHEEEILTKRKKYHDSMHKGTSFEELRLRAEARYQEFAKAAQRTQYEISHMFLQRHQTRQMVQALEGRGWSKPSPYGVCSASLLREAEERHQERKALMEQAIKLGGLPSMQNEGELPLAMNPQAEEDDVLAELEAKLGYNFSRFDFSL